MYDSGSHGTERQGRLTMTQFFTERLRGRVAISTMAIAFTLLPFPALAQPNEQFGPEGIEFAVTTIVEFEFLESNAAYQSTFGVINLQTGERTPLIAEIQASDRLQEVQVPSSHVDHSGADTNGADFQGTAGITVPSPLAEFEFQARTPYAFYLESVYNGQVATLLYSIRDRNPNQQQQLQFEGDISALGNGGVTLRWDDTGSLLVRPELQDRDFDDFVVRAGGGDGCP